MWSSGYMFLVACGLAVLLKYSEAKSPQLPSFVTPCSRNDPKLRECILKRGREYLPRIISGITELRLPRLDPLFIPQVTVERTGSGSGVGATLTSRNISIRGLKDITFDDVEIELKPNSGRCSSWFTVPRLEIVSKYDVKGRVLILPIEGKGDANFTLVGNKLNYWISYDLTEKSGERFMVPTDDDLIFNTTRAYFKLTNLFNGDKALGDNMNLFLNENWSDVLKEIGPDITVAVKKVIHDMSYGLANTFPFDTIFPGDNR